VEEKLLAFLMSMLDGCEFIILLGPPSTHWNRLSVL